MSLFTYGDFCCEAPLAVSSPRGSTEDLRSVRWLLTAWPPEAAAAPPAASERHRLNDTILSASSEDGDTDGPERRRPTPPPAPPRAASPAQPPPALAALSAQLLSRPCSQLAPEPRPQQPRPLQLAFQPRPQQPRPQQPRPQQLAPEPRPQQLAPESRPQKLAPESRPQQLAPESRPQKLAPESRPQQLAPEPRPQQLAPESRPQQLAPESRPLPPRPQQLPPQPGRPGPRSVTGEQRRAPSPLPAPPRPDFVNSLITVSAETLRRVCGAGGRPWRALPPVAVPLTEQLTACRAVVPLRRLGPGELGRWLAPGRAGRRPTRSVSESLPAPARAPIVRARSWTEAELTSGAAGRQSVWPPAAGRALDSARGGCVSGPPAGGAAAARSGTAEPADGRRLWPVVVSRRAAEEAARAVLGPSRRRRHHSRDRLSAGRRGRCEAPADGGAGDHRLSPSAPQNKAAAEREATSPLKKRPRKHDGSTCHHDYKLAAVQVSAGLAVHREEAKTMEKPEPSGRRRTEVARDSVSVSAKGKEPDTTRTKIRDTKTKSAAATKDKDEHAKTKRSKSLDLKEEDNKAKEFAAMDRHLKHSEGKGAAAAEDKPAGAVKAKEAKRCTKPRTAISLFYPPDQLISTPARLCTEPAACQPLSRSVSAPGTGGRAQLPAAAGTGPTSCSAQDAQRRHSSPARPQQRAGHVTSRPAEPDSTRGTGPTERDPTREAGPTERDSTRGTGPTELDPTRQARPLTPNRKETANQEVANSFLPQWTARDGAADPAVSERRPAPALPAVRSGASPAPAVTGAGAAVPTSAAAAAAAAAHPERPAAPSSGALHRGSSPAAPPAHPRDPDRALAAPPAHPRDPDRALAPLPAPASAHAPNIAAAAAPPSSAVLAPLTDAAGPRTPVYAGRRARRRPPAPTAPSDAERAARRVARRPITAPGAPPPPPPAAVFPGRPHESSDSDDSLDLSAEIRALQDKYRSSSEDEAADSDGAPSRRLRGGAAPAAGSARQQRAPAGTADDSGDSWSTPAHSGDDELSIFVAESDMEWEDPGPSACAQRTPGASSALAANHSPYTAPPRWPPSQPAAPSAAQRLGIARLERPPRGAQRWPPAAQAAGWPGPLQTPSHEPASAPAHQRSERRRPPWGELPAAPRQHRGPLLPRPPPPVALRARPGAGRVPMELPMPQFGPKPPSQPDRLPPAEGGPGDQDTDQPPPPPAAAATPCVDSAAPPVASAELEEGEIPPDCRSQDDCPTDEHAPAAEPAGLPPPLLKAEPPPAEVAELLAGYRHLGSPDYCAAFLRLRPCRCPADSGTHQLPAPGVLRTQLRRLAADGEHPAALQLVRAACERSLHEPGPLLSPGCLASLYDVVVQACVLAGEPAAALQMIADLRSVGIRSPELFHNIIKAQAPAAWLSASLSGLLSALVAGRVELPPATWRQLLQLCVHSHAAHPTWMTLGRMMDVGVMPPPPLVERALRIAQADSDHLLGKSGWLLVRHVRLLTDVRPVARAKYLSRLRWRGLGRLADDIAAALRAVLDAPPGLDRRPPPLPAGRPMPEGSMVAIPRPSPLALAAPPSPQFSPAESEEKATATDSEPAQSPAGRPPDTPRSPEPRSAPSPGLSPLHIKSEVCSVKESPQVPAESLECAEEAGRSPAGDSDRHERATTRSEPALSLLPEAPEPRRPDSVPLQLTFDFEPPPGAVDAAPSGPPVAPDQLQLQRVRRRLEQLAGGAGPQTDPGPADTATPADRRPPADAAEQWTQPAAAGPRRDRAEAEAEAEVAPLVARLRRAVAVGPPAALKALKTELVDGPGRPAELFQRVCSQMLAGGRLSLPERHVVHSVGATLLVRARAAAAWTDAHLAATALLSCRINLLQAVEPAGPVPRHCTAFRVCLTVLEALLHSGNVSDAFHFAKGYGFFPTTRRSQLSTLLPVLSELVRRLSAAGLVPAAVSLLDWLAERSERDRQLFDDDYRLLVDFERLVNVALLAALRAGRPEVALRLHTMAVDQGVCLSTESLRQTLHLRLDRRHFSHVRDLYNLGIAIGVYPHQKVFSPLQVRLPCWLSQEEMVVALEEYVRSVVADFGGVPPVQPLTVLLLAEGGPPAPLGRPLLPEDAGVRLQQACSLLVPPLRLQPGGGPLQFLVTAESLVDKLMTQAASQRGRVASAPGLVRIWDAPPGR